MHEPAPTRHSGEPSPHSALRRARYDVLIRHLPVVPFDAAAAEAYGGIIAQCGWVSGRDFDRMIAAQAMSMQATLVTNNQADFSRHPRNRAEELADLPWIGVDQLSECLASQRQ